MYMENYLKISHKTISLPLYFQGTKYKEIYASFNIVEKSKENRVEEWSPLNFGFPASFLQTS